MPEKKRNHTVPITYLKNFSFSKRNEEYCYVYDKKTGKFYEDNIHNITVENYFYYLRNIDTPTLWEDYYGRYIEPELENVTSIVIKVIKNPLLMSKSIVLDSQIKAKLSFLLVYQLFRGRCARRFEINIAKELTKDVIIEAKNKFPDQYELFKDNPFWESEEFLKTILFKVSLDSNEINKIANILYNRCWVIYRAYNKKRTFITSDNPLMIIDQLNDIYTPFEVGITNGASVCYYSIDPLTTIAMYPKNYYLGAFREFDRKIIHLNSFNEEKFMNQINIYQLKQCERQVFSSDRREMKQIISEWEKAAE